MSNAAAIFRTELPTVFRLVDTVRAFACGEGACYFCKFEQTLLSEPVALNHFRHIEANLGQIDRENCDRLIKKCAPWFRRKSQHRGWQQAFDLLNEANAFAYLIANGASNLDFVPERDEKTPDIEGQLMGDNLLCEVKTINISQEEAEARPTAEMPIGRPRHIQGTLSNPFQQKFADTLRNAFDQIKSFEIRKKICNPCRFIYIVMNFDDRLHEYADRYIGQIGDYDLAWPPAKLALEIKPKFYSAMSNAPMPAIYSRDLSGQWTR